MQQMPSHLRCVVLEMAFICENNKVNFTQIVEMIEIYIYFEVYAYSYIPIVCLLFYLASKQSTTCAKYNGIKIFGRMYILRKYLICKIIVLFRNSRILLCCFIKYTTLKFLHSIVNIIYYSFIFQLSSSSIK